MRFENGVWKHLLPRDQSVFTEEGVHAVDVCHYFMIDMRVSYTSSPVSFGKAVGCVVVYGSVAVYAASSVARGLGFVVALNGVLCHSCGRWSLVRWDEGCNVVGSVILNVFGSEDWQPQTAMLTLLACTAWWCGYRVMGYKPVPGQDTPWWFHVPLIQTPMAIALAHGFTSVR